MWFFRDEPRMVPKRDFSQDIRLHALETDGWNRHECLEGFTYLANG